MKRLLLVDGHYYAYRSFFAIRGLTNSSGEPTNAIFGFLKAIRRMLAELQPEYAAVIWDEGIPARRSDLQPEYKQQRIETPDDLVPQIDEIRKLMPLCGLASLGLPDTEADDLMASYAVAATAAGIHTVLATNDKDLFQLVNEQVGVYSTAKADVNELKEDYAILGRDQVLAKWGVEPECILDVLALTGDSVDNIPGVPGVGPKTAAKLIAEHGRVINLLKQLDAVKNEKLREKLAAAADQVINNLEMVRLDLDLPLPAPIEELTISPQWQPLIDSVSRFEFRTIGREIREEAEAAGFAAEDKPKLPQQGELL